MSDSIAPVGVKIVADMSDFGPKLKAGADQFQDFASKTKASADSLSSGVQAAGAKLTGVFSSLGSAGSDGAFGKLSGYLDEFTSKLSAAGAGWGAFATAAVAAFTAINVAATRTSAQIADMNRLGRVLNTNSQDTQVLTNVFSNAGLDDASARAAVLRFSGHLGEAANDPNSSRATAYHNINLDPAALARSGNVTAMEATIEALHRLPSDAQRNAAAMEIFGRSFLDLADVISRGSDAFRRARDQVRVGGFTERAAENMSVSRRMDLMAEDINNRNGGTIGNRAGQEFGDFSSFWSGVSSARNLGWSLAMPVMARSVGLGGLYPPEAHGGAAGAIADALPGSNRPRFDMTPYGYTPPDDGPNKATLDAQKLGASWAQAGSVLGATSRQAAILTSIMGGATAESVRQLENLDRFNTGLERRAKLEQDVASSVSSTRLDYEKFQESQRDLFTQRNRIFGMLDGDRLNGAALANGRAQANNFLALEASLGHGPSSYAQTGIDPRSMEGQKYLDDFDIRRQNNDRSPEDRIKQVQEAAKQRDDRRNAILQRIFDVLDRQNRDNAEPSVAEQFEIIWNQGAAF